MERHSLASISIRGGAAEAISIRGGLILNYESDGTVKTAPTKQPAPHSAGRGYEAPLNYAAGGYTLDGHSVSDNSYSVVPLNNQN